MYKLLIKGTLLMQNVPRLIRKGKKLLLISTRFKSDGMTLKQNGTEVHGGTGIILNGTGLISAPGL